MMRMKKYSEQLLHEGLVEKKGIIYIWTKESFKSRNLEIKVRDELGVEQQLYQRQKF